ncbi:hypothetical protein [Embleya sp. AB8]|uniref:hypothetical protein n=1 Tax=Embleya sp. AB8 TaxID=3156304 RepID=UPI003C77BF7C
MFAFQDHPYVAGGESGGASDGVGGDAAAVSVRDCDTEHGTGGAAVLSVGVLLTL